MSVGVSIRAGDPVPIHLKLDDRNESKFGQALVYDEGNTLLTTLVLAHVNDGLYLPSTPYLMPGNVSIKVDYRVFNDVGLTDEDTTYRVDLDVFTKQNTIPGLQETTDFTATFAADDSLTATVEKEGELVATFEDDDLSLTVSPDSDFLVEINDDTLTGEIKC